MVLVIIFCVNRKHFLHSRNVKNSKKTRKQMLHFSPLFLSLLCVALMSILKDTDRVSGDHLKGECHHKSLVCWRSLQGLPALYNIWPFWSSVLQNTQVFIFLLFFFICAGENNVVGSDSMTCSEPENYPIILITHEPVLLWKSLIANAITQTSDLCFFYSFSEK